MRRFLPFLPKPPLVPVIRLSGTIGTGTRSLNDEALAPLIDKAFKMKPVAVALQVNSPGGSAVQSSLIAARIRRLAEEKNIPVHAFVEDVDRLKALQGPIHQAFIDHVKRSRGKRLKEDADLFNADIWVGQQSVDLGLTDGVAHLTPRLRQLYGDKVRLIPLGRKRGLFQRLGLSLADETLGAVEDRALWARYGL